jgi:HEAT repeat protein
MSKKHVKEQIAEAISNTRTGESSTARTQAAEHLADLTSGAGAKEVDEKTIGEIISLLDTSDDSVRYWVARCLGNLGLRAKAAIPNLERILTEVDCLQGSKTSASGIRFALAQMGISPPAPKCEATKQ